MHVEEVVRDGRVLEIDHEAFMADMAHLSSPVLSLYVPTTPLAHGNKPAATEAQVKNALGRLDVPSKLAREVLALIKKERHCRTTAIFADAKQCRSLELAIDLPIVDEQSGAIDAQWGQALLAPLHLLGRRTRFAIVLCDRERVRCFEAFAGQCIERMCFVRAHGEAHASGSKQVHPAYVPSRGGAVRDSIDAHDDQMVARMYREACTEIERLIAEHHIDALLIVGPEADRARMIEAMPASLGKRVGASLSSLSTTKADASAVFRRCEDAMQKIHDARMREQIAGIVARDTHVVGERACAMALEQGRVERAVLSWHLPSPVRERLLREARGHSSELYFVEGDLAAEVDENHCGVLAQLRW